MKKSSQNILDYLKLSMSFLNLLMMFFLSGVSFYTVSYINQHFQARRFLDGISYLPLEPMKNYIVVIATYFFLLLIIEIRGQVKKHLEISILLGVVEVVLCLVILYSQSISYTGILFLVTADIIRSLKEEKHQWIFFGLMSVIYIFSDYHIISPCLKMISFDQYLFLLDTGIRFFLLAIKNILSSINMIFFLLYMILLMRKQREENERILYLNKELKTVNEKLNLMNEQLKDYADMQYQMGEIEERNRIAREIHDTLGHTMTGLIVGIEACIRLVDLSAETCKSQLKILAGVARDGLKDIRRSVHKLRPDALENESLDYAIRKMIGEMETLHNIQIAYSMEEKNFNLTNEEDTIYRIVQESITNAIRHGKARFISIQIRQDNQWIVIEIRDDGIGCKEVHKGFGLIHMKERLEMLSGELEYDGSDGFMLIAKIPVRIGEEE